MKNTSESNGSQGNSPNLLPPGIHVGVIPPDGTVLSEDIWLRVLGATEEDRIAFRKSLRRHSVPSVTILGMRLIDATGIRRMANQGDCEDS